MNITIISWDNLGYISLVEEEMKRQGHKVVHIKMNELKYNYPNKLIKLINGVFKVIFNYNLKREILAKRVGGKLNGIPKQDLILVVSSDWLPKTFLKSLKVKTNKLVAWFYDASNNYPRIPKMMSCFDKTYTFDDNDAEKFNMEFLPNFNPYNKSFNEKKTPCLFHVSSNRNNRKQVLENVAKELKKHDFSYSINLISSKKEENNYISISQEKIPLKKVLEKQKESTVQLDIQRDKQVGLSFRVFEAMGLKQKLITTNARVKLHDFYNANNILVINEKEIDIPISFLSEPYKEIPSEIYNKYTIENWVKQILK